jgi:hypothetical protein
MHRGLSSPFRSALVDRGRLLPRPIEACPSLRRRTPPLRTVHRWSTPFDAGARPYSLCALSASPPPRADRGYDAGANPFPRHLASARAAAGRHGWVGPACARVHGRRGHRACGMSMSVRYQAVARRPRRAHRVGPRWWGGEVAGSGGEAEVADSDELVG